MSLKELTSAKHKEIEDMPFTQYMVSGSISKEDYAKYLYQMQVVYGAVEEVASNLNIIDNFPTLPRFYLIKHDYEELVGSNTQHSILPATKDYEDYIKNLTDVKKVYAHMYVRYMGDMAGGQIIKQLVPGSGLFYDFKNLRELMTKFREKLTDDLADEAIVAFNYNIAIMRQLDTSRVQT